jgi:hypothetical protein
MSVNNDDNDAPMEIGHDMKTYATIDGDSESIIECSEFVKEARHGFNMMIDDGQR